jgi:uncharacterized membrane protein (DUF106 family)
MDIFTFIYTYIDMALMPLYRLPQSPIYGYLLGTAVLAVITVIVGEISISLAFMANKKKIANDTDKINRYQDLSFEALRAGNKAAFKACNGIANETFGKSFFSQVSLSAASLWPIFISLGWMQYRFGAVEFHLPYLTFGYLSSFILCYIIVRILLSKIKKIRKESYA